MTKAIRLVALLLCLLVAAPSEAGTHAARVHAVLVALPAFSKEPTPETPEERAERLEPVAEAIWEASAAPPAGFTRAQWAAALAALGKHETHFAKYVQEGRCAEGPVGMRCDNMTSKGPFQQKRVACPRVWELEDGSVEQIHESARCASRLMASAVRRCRSRNQDPLAGGFSGYAGASCIQSWSYRRANTARALAARLGG